MEEERMLVLMMEALDGELSGADSAEFGAHLQGNPDLAQEWRAMLAVDTLFRLTPSLAPPANLAARTLARLPNTAHRRWLTGGLFVTLFLLGLAPVVAFFWFSGQSGGGSLVEVVAASAGQAGTLFQALLRAAVAPRARMWCERTHPNLEHPFPTTHRSHSRPSNHAFGCPVEGVSDHEADCDYLVVTHRRPERIGRSGFGRPVV